ncbi:hypothetical protein TWF694_003050 [Orbilia ellipsospora]
MPDEVWSKTHWESNGFFGCAGNERKLHRTWFRFLVKKVDVLQVKNTLRNTSAISYSWLKTGFFTTWSPDGRQSILCLDCPPEVKDHIWNALQNTDTDCFQFDPYCFHPTVVNAMVAAFDESVWLLRDAVRDVEKNRHFHASTTYIRHYSEYAQELSRHVLHAWEILNVATEVMIKMMRRHRDFMSRLDGYTEKEKEQAMELDDKLDFYHGLLFGFKCRCDSMQQRHQNEISLAQSHAVAADASAMKTIAIIGALFLPATFVSAIFSMSFFSNGGGGSNGPSSDMSDPNSGSQGWSVLPQFWIYWAFAIPLTILAMVFLLGRELYRKLRKLGGRFKKFYQKMCS